MRAVMMLRDFGESCWEELFAEQSSAKRTINAHVRLTVPRNRRGRVAFISGLLVLYGHVSRTAHGKQPVFRADSLSDSKPSFPSTVHIARSALPHKFRDERRVNEVVLLP